MKQHIFRLTRGADLYDSIAGYCKANHIRAGYAACCVGCVTKARVRTADGVTLRTLEEHLEIVSLTGTVSEKRCHLHIAFSREDLSVIGGHLTSGCVVNTTAEVVLCELEDVGFDKVFDPQTGYHELDIVFLPAGAEAH
ncbi:MAG: DNA-binding protein [Clostridiales bacterium]|nr:DNA-binding protein [Clostridiales bacterium]